MIKRNLTIKSSGKIFLLKKQNHNFAYVIKILTGKYLYNIQVLITPI